MTRILRVFKYKTLINRRIPPRNTAMNAHSNNSSASIFHNSAFGGSVRTTGVWSRILNFFGTMALRADAERDLALLNSRLLDDVGITPADRNAILN